MAVITGDVVSGYAWDGKTRPWADYHYKKLNVPFEKAGVYFAVAAGNHDDDGDLNRTELLKLE